MTDFGKNLLDYNSKSGMRETPMNKGVIFA